MSDDHEAEPKSEHDGVSGNKPAGDAQSGRDRSEHKLGPDQADYKVGYKRPPLSSRYKPGETGNPGGRGRKSKPETLAELVEEIGSMLTPIRGPNGERTSIEFSRAVIIRLFHAAMQGDMAAMRNLIRMWERSPSVSRRPMTDDQVAEKEIENLSNEDIERIDDVLQELQQYHGQFGDDGGPKSSEADSDHDADALPPHRGKRDNPPGGD